MLPESEGRHTAAKQPWAAGGRESGGQGSKGRGQRAAGGRRVPRTGTTPAPTRGVPGAGPCCGPGPAAPAAPRAGGACPAARPREPRGWSRAPGRAANGAACCRAGRGRDPPGASGSKRLPAPAVTGARGSSLQPCPQGGGCITPAKPPGTVLSCGAAAPEPGAASDTFSAGCCGCSPAEGQEAAGSAC